MSDEEIHRLFPVSLSEKPVWITDDLVFLGEIPRRFAFEQGDIGKRIIHNPDGNTEPDHLLDDTALAFRSAEGLVIITGSLTCRDLQHHGVCKGSLRRKTGQGNHRRAPLAFPGTEATRKDR